MNQWMLMGALKEELVKRPPLDANAILDRARMVTRAGTDSQLAEALGKNPNAVSVWRRRETIPYEDMVSLAIGHGVSLSWLFFGDGAPDDPRAISPTVVEEVAALISLARMATEERDVDATRAWDALRARGAYFERVPEDLRKPLAHVAERTAVEADLARTAAEIAVTLAGIQDRDEWLRRAIEAVHSAVTPRRTARFVQAHPVPRQARSRSGKGKA